MARKFLRAVVAIGVLVAVVAVEPAIGSINPAPQDYVPITPCSVADTRSAVAPSPNGKLTSAGSPYTFQVAGAIPSTQRDPGETCTSAPGSALGVVVNVVAIQPDGLGNLRVSPAGVVASGGVVNYQNLTPVLNNSNAIPVEVTIVPGGAPVGNIDIVVNGADVHVRLVVMGYFVQAPTATDSAGAAIVSNVHPVQVLQCIVAVEGIFPFRTGTRVQYNDIIIGEIRWFGGNYAPLGFQFCDGQILQITSNTALFSVFGTTYGGDGRNTFGIPDMRGRSPMHEGDGPGLPAVGFGDQFGDNTVSNVPSHLHGIPVDTP